MSELVLAFDDVGEGERTFLLIHGAFGSRADYSEQVAFFMPSARVVRMDLRGHGESPKPHEGYSIDQFARDVAALCDSIELRDANVVGHSMGGAIALELAKQRPDIVSAVATLDSPSVIPGWHKAHAGLYDDRLHGTEYREAIKEFLLIASAATDDKARWHSALTLIDEMPREAVQGTWDALGQWNPSECLPSISVPVLYIDHGQPDLDYAALRSLLPQVLTAQTVAGGHRALYETPEQVNSMLDFFFSNAQVLAEEARVKAGAFEYQN